VRPTDRGTQSSVFSRDIEKPRVLQFTLSQLIGLSRSLRRPVLTHTLSCRSTASDRNIKDKNTALDGCMQIRAFPPRDYQLVENIPALLRIATLKASAIFEARDFSVFTQVEAETGEQRQMVALREIIDGSNVEQAERDRLLSEFKKRSDDLKSMLSDNKKQQVLVSLASSALFFFKQHKLRLMCRTTKLS